MLASTLKMPPATHILRPERRERPPGNLDRIARVFTGALVRPFREHMSGIRSIVSRVEHYSPALEGMDDEKLKRLAKDLSISMHMQGIRDDLVAHAFALVRETAGRAIGMRHFDCQLMGGQVLLKGMVAEMETGEGKTLTATLAASTAAMAGVPVHVISVNDYLTARDAEWMGPIYRALGLRVGCITHDMDLKERRAAYQCDVTYCTNKEIAFDYLRDRITLGDRSIPLRLQAEYLYGDEARGRRLLLRGLHFAIVDEADSVLVDEARTPLVISRASGGKDEQHTLEQAIEIAEGFQAGIDYDIEYDSRKINLTEVGKQKIREMAGSLGVLWTGSVWREELVSKALTALQLFQRDDHYLVQDGKVQIVDEFTGRLMPDRSWERGLHQLIEIKEGCEITEHHETAARISYQQFFRHFLHLAGMTGTAREAKGEMWSVYGLPVVRIPTNRLMKRTRYPDRVFSSAEKKWQAVVERIREQNKVGRPVLVGTRTVAASEHASRCLTEIDLKHQVLNAKQDEEEAEIIARAGEGGCITIATNMAGRGTDIKLDPDIANMGGLHVILTERHEAARIDRQLAGRCGRQGDPGSYEAILSLEDQLFEAGRVDLMGIVLRRFFKPGSSIWDMAANLAILWAQKKIERLHARMRRELLKMEEDKGSMLSFSGRFE